jgi:2-polyprenyl-6-methoxyphenol hydroxylase-like FAD-dependent oxidoreductase
MKADIDGAVMATVDAIAPFGARVRLGRREERFQGATDLPNFFRKPHGPGWALVGDAGCHKDPALALGICDAFRDAELLTAALDQALSGKFGWDIALSGYERRRNELGRADYWQNLSVARFEPPPDALLKARAAVRGNAAATRQFFLDREGMTPG